VDLLIGFRYPLVDFILEQFVQPVLRGVGDKELLED
jgi:hypothetical protein